MGNPSERDTSRTQGRSHDAPNALDRVRAVAQRDREARFTALLHHVTTDRLREAYRRLGPRAAAGVDGVTKAHYGEHLEERLEEVLRSFPESTHVEDLRWHAREALKRVAEYRE